MCIIVIQFQYNAMGCRNILVACYDSGLNWDTEFNLLIEKDINKLVFSFLFCIAELLYDVFPDLTKCLVFPLCSKMALAWYVVALCELKPLLCHHPFTSATSAAMLTFD